MTGRSTRACRPRRRCWPPATKADKRAAFDDFAKALEGDDAKGEAITPKAKKADKKADEAEAASRRVDRGLSMLEEALEHLVKGIVDNPDDVQVASRNLRRGRVLEVRVHPDDLGKVIGRNGRTARALRTVVGAIGGRGIRVDLVDVDQVR